MFYDLSGIASVAGMSDTDLYIKVEQQLESLCRYALNGAPVAKDFNGDDIYIGGTFFLHSPSLEKVLESLREAQKD